RSDNGDSRPLGAGPQKRLDATADGADAGLSGKPSELLRRATDDGSRASERGEHLDIFGRHATGADDPYLACYVIGHAPSPTPKKSDIASMNGRCCWTDSASGVSAQEPR